MGVIWIEDQSVYLCGEWLFCDSLVYQVAHRVGHRHRECFCMDCVIVGLLFCLLLLLFSGVLFVVSLSVPIILLMMKFWVRSLNCGHSAKICSCISRQRNVLICAIGYNLFWFLALGF